MLFRSLSVKNGLPLREVPPVKVQSALLEAGVLLSLCKYSDVPPEHPYFKAVQLSNLHGFIEPIEPPHAPSYNIGDLDDPVLAMAMIKGADKGIFGVNEILTHSEMVSMLNKARAAAGVSGGQDQEDGSPYRFVTRGVFAEAVFQTFGLAGGAKDSEAKNRSGKTRIEPRHRFAEAVNALDSLGALSLYPEGEFLPARPITRGEAVEILMKAVNAPGAK